jgi:hypothetical protein
MVEDEGLSCGEKERGCAKGCRVGIRKVERRAVVWGKKKDCAEGLSPYF